MRPGCVTPQFLSDMHRSVRRATDGRIGCFTLEEQGVTFAFLRIGVRDTVRQKLRGKP